ncbi:MAG: hypothetical protein GQ564_12185 [Bacteroidales bacterium]|nr:hypothetical protein [Bacteroidales bacterium]
MGLLFTGIGLLLASIGTFFTIRYEKPIFLIMGIALIGIGQIFAWIATNNASLQSEKRLIAAFEIKLKEFDSDVDSLIERNNISSEIKKEIVNKTKNVSNWAKENIPNYDSTIIQLERRIVDNKEEKYNLNREWQPIYKETFIAFEDLAKTYNSQNKDSIIVTYSEAFPQNIYKAKLNEFYLTINFFNELIYDFSMNIDEESFYPEQPYFVIHLTEYNDKNELVPIEDKYCFFKFSPDYDRIFFHSKEYFKHFPLKTTYEIEDSPIETVINLITELFFYQIYLLEEKK